MASDPTERRLAAILSADVVSYSRLMAEDELEKLASPAGRPIASG